MAASKLEIRIFICTTHEQLYVLRSRPQHYLVAQPSQTVLACTLHVAAPHCEHRALHDVRLALTFLSVAHGHLAQRARFLDGPAIFISSCSHATDVDCINSLKTDQN